MSIPIVIVHIGNSYYLKDVVEFNAKKNQVYLIGCNNNAYLGDISNVQHIHFADLTDSYLDYMKAHFYELEKGIHTKVLNQIHPDYQCVNNGTYQFLCFARVYFVKQLMMKFKLSLVFHLDSDCFMLEDTGKVAEVLGKKLAYGIEPIHNNIHMVGSIHNAYLTETFCEAFIQLYEDIYINQSKRKLLEHKVMCIRSGIGGGKICDMNLYYILWQQKLMELVDLTQPFYMDNELCVFDHCIGNATGFEGGETYKFTKDEKGSIKALSFEGGKVYQETVSGKKIRLLSIHFNGQDKQRIAHFRQLI